MNTQSVWDQVQAFVEHLQPWLVQDVFTLINLVQIPAVLLTGAVTWLITRPLHKYAVDWVGNVSAGQRLDWIALHQEWLVHRLVPLLAPVAWIAGLAVSLALAEAFDWPSGIIRICINLLAAWLIIRLAADFVRYEALAQLISVFAWIVAALNILHLLGPTVDLLDSGAVVLGGIRVSLLTVVKGIFSFSILLWLATSVSRFLERRITRIPEVTPRAQVLLGKLIQITLVALAVVIALSSIGIDLSQFAFFTGALGIGLGLGLQKTVSNLFSGIVLLLDKSIKPGDVIEVGGTFGWVTSLGARYVSVETRDGVEYLIPNEDIITRQVVNWSHRNTIVRLKVPIRVPLSADLDEVCKLILLAALEPPRILARPAPVAFVMAFGESAIELELRFWISDAHNGVANVKSQALLAVWRQFKAHGITLPYPKHDVIVGRSKLGERG
ncbi:mechanosensitive ion channel family protein [Methylovirgula sp. 4M-Z18]|uniref:mechanosensitive ion channel family protein n=1 Tax=Methylovirgula sp. 4M-Z18 TaxID=2293567 RepID=UPI001314CF6B|nr:mechanosensitive ion channel domain-containing protein [Methylovirgula sp. 4M-Z18]